LGILDVGLVDAEITQSAFSPGRMVAHVRSDALSLARQRESDAEEK